MTLLLHFQGCSDAMGFQSGGTTNGECVDETVKEKLKLSLLAYACNLLKELVGPSGRF